MEFDYKYTCSEIDQVISDTKDIVERYIEEILDEACPLLTGQAKSDFIKSHSTSMNEEITDEFEILRTLNSDMRAEAERQMEECTKELEASEELVEEHEQKIADLEKELTDMQIEFDND